MTAPRTPRQLVSSAVRRAVRSPASLWAAEPLDLAAITFTVSITAFLASGMLNLGPLEIAVRMAGTATCGFSWLFARALFRNDAGEEVWPLWVVGLLMATGVLIDLFADARNGSGPGATGVGMAASAHELLGSTVLLLAILEAWFGYRPDLPDDEKRFRLLFAAAYGGLMATSVVWVRGAPAGAWADRSADEIRLTCATLAVGFALWAWRYRRSHPLPKPKRRRRKPTAISDDEAALAEQIRGRLEEDKAYLEPDLKLADFAERIGQADYKVRNCVTGALGFRNFNHMLNHYRIDAAKEALSDAGAKGASILAVALDCGFSSIGPFNRAFKAETGVTPSAYRAGLATNPPQPNG